MNLIEIEAAYSGNMFDLTFVGEMEICLIQGQARKRDLSRLGIIVFTIYAASLDKLGYCWMKTQIIIDKLWIVRLFSMTLYKNLGYEKKSLPSTQISPAQEIEKTAAIAISLSRSAI